MKPDTTNARGRIPVLVLTGPVGVGKTTVAGALSDLLTGAGLAHAVIDLDWLRWCHPSPAHDPFQLALGVQNLACVWSSYRAAGAERLILVDIVESRATVDSYRAAIAQADFFVVRLQAAVPTLLGRIAGREVGASREWHQRRAVELTTLMDEARVEDLLIDTESRGVFDIARAIAVQSGWLSRSAVDT